MYDQSNNFCELNIYMKCELRDYNTIVLVTLLVIMIFTLGTHLNNITVIRVEFVVK